MKKLGLSQILLIVVFEAIVTSQYITYNTYAAPAWRGYASRADIDLIQILLKQCDGILSLNYHLELLDNCDKALQLPSRLSTVYTTVITTFNCTQWH